jgi:hypothetical protein
MIIPSTSHASSIAKHKQDMKEYLDNFDNIMKGGTSQEKNG